MLPSFRFFQIFLLFISCGMATLYGQLPSPKPYGDSILWTHLKPHIEILTSDSLEGREAGTLGEVRAAQYLENNFSSIGLRPVVPASSGDSSFRQEMQLEVKRIENGWIKTREDKWDHLSDIIFWGGMARGRRDMQVIYCGEGKEEDLSQIDVEGKLVLVQTSLTNIPQLIETLREKEADGCLIVSASSQNAFDGQMRLFRLRAQNPAYRLSSTQTSLRNFPVIAISPKIASKILKISENKWQKNKIRLGLEGQKVQVYALQKRIKVPAYNMLGFIQGSEYPEEVIILSAHYDHLGMRRGNIHPGADDNAAGVSALLEIARVFRLAEREGIKPLRSIVFFACTAEEKGLLGSRYYSKHPIFGLDQTIVNLNFDMIGHLDDAHQDNPRFVSIVGSDWLSQDLHQIHEHANKTYVQLELDYTYNSKNHPERFYYRSDQYNFAKHGIPVIFYTSGDHEDYHRPSDRLERLSPERLEGVARLIFYTTWEIAHRKQSIKIDLKP